MSEDAARRPIRESAEMLQRLLAGEQAGIVARAAGANASADRTGHKLLLFGNGGSAAEAQHIACELVGRYLKERPSLPAIALVDNTASLTAIGNDYRYEDVFVRQLEAFGAPGDVALALSTSGRSKNVVAALRAARERGMVTVGLTGADGGEVAEISDICIRIPSDETPRIQEGHTVVVHVLCELVEEELFP